MKRLLKYVKPHFHTVLVSLFLVLVLIGTQLMSPIIIGEAIDQYISGYQKPFAETEDSKAEVVHYRNRMLTRDFEWKRTKEVEQLVLYKDYYYLFQLNGQKEIQNSFICQSQGLKIMLAIMKLK